MIIDKENFKQVILDSPNQLKRGLDLARSIKAEGNFKNIIICGMGGSALPAEILISINVTNLPIFIHKDYNLPETANEGSLVICISYSGNTEETISALKRAIKNNFKIVGLATGGKIEKICSINNIPFVKLPAGIQPRSATGYIFSALIKVLINSGLAKDISAEILETSRYLGKIVVKKEIEGKKLAKKLIKKIPIVYSSNQFKTAALIWKIKFNENSKIPAFYNFFPELNHNEMVGYTGIKKLGAKNFLVVILQDYSDNERVLKRMDLTSKLIKKSGVKIETVKITGNSLLQKIFLTLLLGDWASYYLAIFQKIDPTPVKMVEDLKKQL